MTISEATTDLSIQLAVKRKLGKDHQANAIQLGIEALSFYKIMKLKRYFNPDYLLPGETKE